jgi:hypothetical protein
VGVVGQLSVADGGKVEGVGGRAAVEWRWRSSGGGGGGGEGGGGGDGGGGGGGGGGGVAVEIAVAIAVVAVVVEMAVEVARSVAVAVDRAFATATAAVEGTGNNQPNYHIVVGVIDASSSSSLFITRRAFSRRLASSRCSVVGLDVNVVGDFDASSSLFVVPPRLLPPLHCRLRRRRRCRRRS